MVKQMACQCQSQILDDWLTDPLIRLVMKADNVDPAEIKALCARIHLSSRTAEGSKPEHMAVYKAADPTYRSGVGIMLLNRRNEVFVGQRIGFLADAWQMPQGGIEPREEPHEAVLRELREEIGTDAIEFLAESEGWLRYDLPPDIFGTVWNGRWRGQQQKWFACRFIGCDSQINIATEHPEFSAWRWVRSSELADLIVAFKRQLYLDVLNQFRNVA